MYVNTLAIYPVVIVDGANNRVPLTTPVSITFTSPDGLTTITKVGAALDPNTVGEVTFTFTPTDIPVVGTYSYTVSAAGVLTHISGSFDVVNKPKPPTLHTVSNSLYTGTLVMITHNGSPVDLTGLTVDFLYRSGGSTIYVTPPNAPVVLDAINGVVSFSFTPIGPGDGYFLVGGAAHNDVIF